MACPLLWWLTHFYWCLALTQVCWWLTRPYWWLTRFHWWLIRLYWWLTRFHCWLKHLLLVACSLLPVAYSILSVAYSFASVACSQVLVAYLLLLLAMQHRNGTVVDGLATAGQKQRLHWPAPPPGGSIPVVLDQVSVDIPFRPRKRLALASNAGSIGQVPGLLEPAQKRRRVLRSTAVTSGPETVPTIVVDPQEPLPPSSVAPGRPGVGNQGLPTSGGNPTRPLRSTLESQTRSLVSGAPDGWVPAGVRLSRKRGAPSDAVSSEPQQMAEKSSMKRPRHTALQRARPAAQAEPGQKLRSQPVASRRVPFRTAASQPVAPRRVTPQPAASQPVTSRHVTRQPAASPFAASKQAERADRRVSSKPHLAPLVPPKPARTALPSSRTHGASLARRAKGVRAAPANPMGSSKKRLPAKAMYDAAKAPHARVGKASAGASARFAAPARGLSNRVAASRAASRAVAVSRRRLQRAKGPLGANPN